MKDDLVVNGVGRRCVGLLILLVAIAASVIGINIGWGIAWTIWIPAMTALIPSWHLLRRHRLERHETRSVRCHGRLRDLSGSTLEFLPTAGLWALLVHGPDGEWAAGLWLTRRRAETIAAWLDQVAGTALPRRDTAHPLADR